MYITDIDIYMKDTITKLLYNWLDWDLLQIYRTS